MTKTYSNSDITVLWQPDKCIHSTRCFRSLPEVFHPARRPWITMDSAPTEDIIRTVENCPSGALSYTRINSEPEPEPKAALAPEWEIRLSVNGPLLVKGSCTLRDADGNEISKSETFALCRCGSSSKKPFCDGTHKLIGFQG